ncbi:MAG: GDSL-type esterase/lipase family protein [Actinobacteria bacterium]|nr:GDSL-type esterase/lipase family protein [Actinomycetota bacterium]
MTDKNKNRNNSRIMAAVLAAVIVMSLAFYFYFFYFNNRAADKFQSSAETQNSNPTQNSGSMDSDQLDPNPQNAENFNLNISEIRIEKDINSSEFIAKSSDIYAGDRITVEIVIKNESSKMAENISVISLLPQKLEDISPEENSGGLYDPLSKKIFWDISEIGAGKIATIKFSAIAGKDFEDGEKFTVKASAFYGDKLLSEKASEGIIDGIADYSSSTVKAKDLSGGKIWSRDKIKYTILVKNSGKKDGFNITLNCPVPVGTGYVEGTAEAKNSDFTLSPNKSLLKWKIGKLKRGEVKEFSFNVFVADYLTFETEIKSGFFLEADGQEIELETTSLKVSPVSFHSVVCMGDSHVVISKWPEILAGLLEKQYTHAKFNIIPSGVKGEMANQAIGRFDSDVRIHKPDILIIGYGTNDAGEEAGLFRYHMDILLRQAVSTGAKVFVYGVGFIDTSIPKWINKANYTVFNDILKNDLCPKYGAVYIDLYSIMSKDPKNYFKKDGMHWTKAGTELAANEIFKTITRYLDIDGGLLPDIEQN